MFEDEIPDPGKMTNEELAAYISRPFETPTVPCDLLRPIMRGIMGRQVADLVFAAANCGG